ncbi:MAG: hypothetical protein AAF493_24390, partial [Pseudomonadota bacterium]
ALESSTYFITAAGFIGRVGQYFFRVVADREGEAVDQKSVQLLSALAGLGGGSEARSSAAKSDAGDASANDLPPGLLALKSAFDLSEGDIAFEAANAFQYDFAKDFWFGTVDRARSGRVFLHLAVDDAGAKAIHDALVEEQRYEYADVDTESGDIILRHEFLKTYFSLAVSGRYLFGVDNIAERPDVERLMIAWRKHIRSQSVAGQ